MPKLTRLTKNLITKSSLLGEPSTPGYVEITSNMLRRNQNLSDLTDKAEARKNLGVIGVDDIDVGPTGDTVVRRGESGTIKAADAVEANDVITKLQLDNKTFDLSGANITGVLPITKGGLGTTTLEDARNVLGLKPVALSGNYNDLTNKPALKTVATSGRYEDLTIEGKSSYIPAPMPKRTAGYPVGIVNTIRSSDDIALPQGGNCLVIVNFDNSTQNNIELAIMAVIPGGVKPKDFPSYVGGLGSDWLCVSTIIVHSYWKLS